MSLHCRLWTDPEVTKGPSTWPRPVTPAYRPATGLRHRGGAPPAEKARGPRAAMAGTNSRAILELIRLCDALVVKRDRLGRATRDVLNLAHELEQERRWPSSPRTGILHLGRHRASWWQCSAWWSRLEPKFILERQRAGIEAAKAKGGVYKAASHLWQSMRCAGCVALLRLHVGLGRHDHDLCQDISPSATTPGLRKQFIGNIVKSWDRMSPTLD
jgi:hypothetical protein